MRLQIINTTGRAQDTKIIDAVTGEPLEGVKAVTIWMTPHNYVTAELSVILRHCDVLAEATVTS